MGEGEVESTADAWNLEASLTPETRGTREWDELRDSAACAYRASAVAATTPRTVASVPARVAESDSSAAGVGWGTAGARGEKTKAAPIKEPLTTVSPAIATE